MRRRWVMATLVAASWAVLACDESTPTSIDDSRFPVSPRTVEFFLAWEDFAAGLTVYGGYGTPSQLGAGVVARAFEGELDARTLVRFARFPTVAAVKDSTGATRTDSSFAYVAGRVVVRLDTLSATNGSDPVTLALAGITAPWHVATANWSTAIDTAGDRRAWPEPGAGPVVALGEAVWDPATGDSIVFPVDSVQLAAWADTTDSSRGARLSLESAGHRLDVRSISLRIDSRPSSNPDTLITLASSGRDQTFIYDPMPEPPPGGIRVGGAPSWRTVIEMDLPRVLNGPASLCEAVGCPFVLEPNLVNHASLHLRTLAVEPRAFLPTDSLRFDMRTVLTPERLPKAPLGGSFVGPLGQSIAPEAFGDEAGQTVVIPVTAFVRALVVEDTTLIPSRSVALLSVVEPLSISFGAFEGPGGAGAPVLRLIVTASDTVDIS